VVQRIGPGRSGRDSRWLALLLLVGPLAGCARSHRSLSGLQPREQIQALVLDHMATEFFQGSSTDPDDFRVFLSVAPTPFADASQAVLDYVASSFRSARLFSAVASHDVSGVTERGTGKRGAILWVEPFSISGDGPISIKAGYFVHGKHAEGFEYRLQRGDGKWTILERKSLWVS